MRKIITILMLSASYFQIFGQECPEPVEPLEENWTNGDFVHLIYSWTEPATTCDSIYYEIEYGPLGFTPGQSEGILISPILDQPGGNYYTYYEEIVEIEEDLAADGYMRSVCICDTSGNGSGNENSVSGWVAFNAAPCWCEELYTESAGYSLTILNADEVYYCEEDVPDQTYEFVGEPEGKWGDVLAGAYSSTTNNQIDENTTIVEKTVVVYQPYCDLSICDIGDLIIETEIWTYTIIMDNEAPVVDCSAITTEYESENSFSLPDLTEELIVDESCSFTVIQSPSPGEILSSGDHNVLFTVTDASGNETACETLITVSAPDFGIETNLEQYQVFQCEDEIPQLEYTLSQTWINGIENSIYFLEETENTEITECGELITHQLTFTDSDFNILSQFTYEVEITDTTEPVWDGDTQSELETSCATFDIPIATATDNCTENVEVTYSEEMVVNGCSITFYRTYTATDDCGNFNSFIQTIDIIDETPPVFEVEVDDFTLSCGMPIPDPLEVTAIDYCSSVVSIEFSEVFSDLGCNPEITRTWIAMDECDNVSTLTQTIMIEDTEAPEISICPDVILVSLNDQELYEIQDYSDLIEVVDNCSAELSISQSIEPTLTSDNSTQSVTITIQDECGNSTSCEVPLSYEIGDNLIEKNPVELTFFPNPSNGHFTVDLLLQSEANLSIYSSIGQKVAQRKIVKGKNIINLENLNTGLYIGQLWSNDGNNLGKIELIVE